MGPGPGAQLRVPGLSGFRVEPPKFARTLRGVPDSAVYGGRYIVRTGSRW